MSASTGPRAMRRQAGGGAVSRAEFNQLASLAHESIVELGRRQDADRARIQKLENALKAAHEAAAKKNGGLIVVPH